MLLGSMSWEGCGYDAWKKIGFTVKKKGLIEEKNFLKKDALPKLNGLDTL